MGPHKKVACPKCDKEMRSDNVKRHLKTCDGSGRKRLPFAAPLELMNKLKQARVRIPPSDVACPDMVFKYRNLDINLGNLTHRRDFNRLQTAAFRGLMTPQLLTEKVDGVHRVSEDDYAKDFLDRYLPSKDEFDKFFYYHAICRTTDWPALKSTIQVLDPACECNCNRFKYVMAGTNKMVAEDGTSPFTWDDVAELFEQRDLGHVHFIMKFPKTVPIDTVKDLLKDACQHKNDAKLMRNMPAHCWTRLDVARVLLYIQRSENLKGFCSHHHHAGTDFPPGGWRVQTSKSTRLANPPPNGVVKCLERIEQEDRHWWVGQRNDIVSVAKANCANCRKVKKTPMCNYHMYLHPINQ